MANFKTYITEADGGGGTLGHSRLRSPKLHPVPTKIGADPIQYHHQMINWEIQLVSWFIQLYESETLIPAGGTKVFVPVAILNELHPEAKEFMVKSGLLKGTTSGPTVVNQDVYLHWLVKHQIEYYAGYRPGDFYIEPTTGDPVPDPEDPSGYLRPYYFIAAPMTPVWLRESATTWTVVPVQCYEGDMGAANRTMIDLRNAERGRNMMRNFGNELWGQMTQRRLARANGTDFFGQR